MTQQVEEVSVTSPVDGFMWAMVQAYPRGHLMRIHVPVPDVRPHDLLIQVTACGICELDRSLMDGLLRPATRGVIPGHEVVGRVVDRGHHVTGFSVGDRVGVPRLGWACGSCSSCRRGLEHLCDDARLTGQTVNGGMAEYLAADYRFCVHLPGDEPDTSIAPLLCNGAMAFRALQAVGEAQRIGVYGKGAGAGLAARLAELRGREVFTWREREAGAACPESLDAALVFAPSQDLFADALRAVTDGATVVWVSTTPLQTVTVSCALLVGERLVRSVAGFTRQDLRELLAFAATVPIRPDVEVAPLVAVEEELARIATGRARGSAVLQVGG